MSRADIMLKKIIEEIPCTYPEIESIRVFGSYAKGTSSARSDVDILILTQNKITDHVRRSRIREDIDAIAQQFRIDTDIVFYTSAIYDTDTSRFTEELKINKLIFKREEGNHG